MVCSSSKICTVTHLNFITHVVLSIFLILSRFCTVMFGVILPCTVRSRLSVSSHIEFLILLGESCIKLVLLLSNPNNKGDTCGKIPKAFAYIDNNGSILYLCLLLYSQYKLPKLPAYSPPCLFHLNEFSNPLLIRIPPLIRDQRVDVILDTVFDAL